MHVSPPENIPVTLGLALLGAQIATAAAIVLLVRYRKKYLPFILRLWKPVPSPSPSPKPEPYAAPVSLEARAAPKEVGPPSWLAKLQALGFQTYESQDITIVAMAPMPGYVICVGPVEHGKVCASCGARNVRKLGETNLLKKSTGARISWIGLACGTCAGVDLTNPKTIRFLNMMLADCRNMLDVIRQAELHSGSGFHAMISMMMETNEAVLQERLNRSAAIRKLLPVEATAKVLPFDRQFRRKPRKRIGKPL